MSNQDWEEANPERLYVISRGRGRKAATAGFDLVTLIIARSRPEPTMQPEHAAILRICGSPLSVAEISAYLSLPNSLVTVLLADLLAEHRIEARAPIPRAALPDLSLLEAVINGLQRL
ncbi:DUF742 domain-containing protein [Streptomyces sp. TLI_171]|uniref:DUF742 domain-containing protein n=1 Tax=Streptomyces sp. TLI_171 TaxID=1938859 RepID=UPI000C1A6FFE|nr:DUF742 domain-containing protein [Streptomyces sp. TLI_171]RKE17939.1 uncharacterized protein DUF742 [Streptomyces sp. TLI_171]